MKKRALLLLMAVLSGALYIAVQLTPRIEFTTLIAEVSLLFGAFASVMWHLARYNKSGHLPLIVAFMAVVFRLIFLFHSPMLSDDYFRFIWDGNITASGENPYLHKPQDLEQETSDIPGSRELLDNMNSRQYHSVYPPASQYLFAIASVLSGGRTEIATILLRLILIIADFSLLFTLPILLRRLGIQPHYAALYLINPLVVIEGTGNLHFEPVVCAFLVPAFSALISGKQKSAAFLLGMASGLKALPLILLPAFSAFAGLRKAVPIAVIVFFTLFIPFIPMLESGSLNMLYSFDLYFRNFEFNASLYYAVRQFGYFITSYNIIGIAGPLLASLTIIAVLSMSSFLKKGDNGALFKTAFLSIICYYFLSTTVHPWYIINLIVIGIAGGFTWTAMTWSFTVILSYNAYSSETVSESLIILLLEYLPVYTVFILEFSGIISGIRNKSTGDWRSETLLNSSRSIS